MRYAKGGHLAGRAADCRPYERAPKLTVGAGAFDGPHSPSAIANQPAGWCGNPFSG